MDVPISVGVILTLAISFSETVLGGRDGYFDAAVSLRFLPLVGRWLDHQLRAKAQSAAGDLLALQTPTATLVDGLGQLVILPLSQVKPGNLLLVRPGERVPVDAEVEGASALDNSLLTGETAPARSICPASFACGYWRLLKIRRSRGSRGWWKRARRPGRNMCGSPTRPPGSMSPWSILPPPQPSRLDGLWASARSARRRALEDFGFAALYNLAAPAAMLGLVNPFVAAQAMSGSSLAVTLNALRTGARR